MSNKNFLSNTLLLLVVQISNYVAPLIVLPYLSRVLGVISFGEMAILLSICGVSLIFTDFGFSLSGAAHIVKIKNDSKLVNKYIANVTIIRLMVSIFVALSVLIYFEYFDYQNTNAIIKSIVICLIFLQSIQFTFLFQGIEKMGMITYSSIISKTIFIGMIFLLVKNQNDLTYVLFCYLISQLILTLLSIYGVFKHGYSFAIPSIDYVKKSITDNYMFALSRTAVSIYSRANSLLVGIFSGASQAGFYSSSEKLYQAGQSSTSPLTQALYPYMVRTKNISFLFKVILAAGIPVFAACTFSVFYSAEIIVFVFGEDFLPASEILGVLMICLVINFISANIGYPGFAAFNRLDVCNKSVIVGSMIYLLSFCFFYFTSGFNAINAAYSLLITESSVLLVRLFFFTKLFLNSVKNKSAGNL